MSLLYISFARGLQRMFLAFCHHGVSKGMGMRMEENRRKWLSAVIHRTGKTITFYIYSYLYRLFDMNQNETTSCPHPLPFVSYLISQSI